MKTIIAGSRTVSDYSLVENAIAQIDWEITEVISGCASGVDCLGERWANKHRLPVKTFPAKWNIYGKSAGFIRNEEMACYADALLAIWDGKSRGTKNMIDCAKMHGLKLKIHMV